MKTFHLVGEPPPKRGKRSRRPEQAMQLFDHIAARPNNETDYNTVRDELGWDYGTFREVVKEFRRIWSDDKINLVCVPNGYRHRWLYRLTSDSDSLRIWNANRLEDAHSRALTIRDVAQSVLKGSDGRSREGRLARKYVMWIGRLLEDIETMEAEAL